MRASIKLAIKQSDNNNKNVRRSPLRVIEKNQCTVSPISDKKKSYVNDNSMLESYDNYSKQLHNLRKVV